MPQIGVRFSWVPAGLYAIEWSTGRIGRELLDEKASNWPCIFKKVFTTALISSEHFCQRVDCAATPGSCVVSDGFRLFIFRIRLVLIIIISSLMLYSRILTSFHCVSVPVCPRLPVWVQQSHHRLPNHVAFEFFFSPLLICLSYCLQ